MTTKLPWYAPIFLWGSPRVSKCSLYLLGKNLPTAESKGFFYCATHDRYAPDGACPRLGGAPVAEEKSS